MRGARWRIQLDDRSGSPLLFCRENKRQKNEPIENIAETALTAEVTLKHDTPKSTILHHSALHYTKQANFFSLLGFCPGPLSR